MIATHIDEGGEKRQIKLETKRGKLVVDRFGMVKIVGGNFNDMEKISLSYLEENFKIGEN